MSERKEKRDWKDIPSRYMMATKAFHLLGDISCETPSLCSVYGEDSENYIGAWVEGFGFFDVKFPKDTTRELTGEEVEEWDDRVIAINDTPRYAVHITPVEISKESPVIVLPKDKTRQSQLRAKTKEYKERLQSSRFTPAEKMGIRYRIIILERLLKNREVSTWEISQEMAKIPDLDFNDIYFDRACAIIEDYCKTGGANLIGGTGLSKASAY